MKKYSFRRQHWVIIGICFVLFLIANAVTSDSENVILPKLAAANGWDYGLVLTLATVAGCSSVLGSLVLGKICEKRGGKFSVILGLIASAFFVFLYGTSKSLAVFTIGLIGTICCGQSISFFGANAVIANWFPKKKGLAMGLVSVGAPTATIIMVSLLNTLVGKTGITGGVFAICAVLLAVAVISFVLIHNTPAEVGVTPDNLPLDEPKDEAGVPTFGTREYPLLGTREILRRKEFWLIAVIVGICSMSQTGLMAQWFVRYTTNGFSESLAAVFMSFTAVAGIFGSMVAGWVENKMGTKRAYVILAVWFAVALVLNFTNVLPLIYVSIPMFGLSITLFQIFMPAFEISIFGRENFRQVNGLLFPIVNAFGQLTFVVMAICMHVFGEIRYAYVVFAVLLGVSIVLNWLLPKGEVHG